MDYHKHVHRLLPDDRDPHPAEGNAGAPAAPEAGAGAGAGIAGAAGDADLLFSGEWDDFLSSETYRDAPRVMEDRYSVAALRDAEARLGPPASARPVQHAAVYQLMVPAGIVNTPDWRPRLEQLLEAFGFTAESGVVSRRVALASSLRRPPVLG